MCVTHLPIKLSLWDKSCYTVDYNNINRSTSNQCVHKTECLLSTVWLRKE